MPINPCRNAKCEHFNRALPIDAKNCPFCGESLGNAVEDANSGGRSINQDKSDFGLSRSVEPSSRPRLKLVHSAGQEFHLHSEMGYIGRSSPASVIVPEIDLKGIPNDGVISRGAHARVYWDEAQNCYVIVDNSSRNGTFLDGIQLKSDTPYRLKPGTSLQLGQDGLVSFRVVIV